MYWQESWQLWLSAFCVIAIYSYLYKDNPLYRTMVQVFIGIQVGYNVIVQWRDILYPRWWLPMLDGFNAIFNGGPGSPWGALWALVGLLGLLWYFQLSRRYLWLSRIVIGVMIGIGAGVTFKTQLGTNLPQLTDTFRPLAPAAIGAQPRQLFELPASSAVPLLMGSVLVAAAPDGPDASTISATESFSGQTLWTRHVSFAIDRLSAAPDVISASGDHQSANLLLSSGAFLQPPLPKARDHEPNPEPYQVPGTDTSVEWTGGRLVARDTAKREKWSADLPGSVQFFETVAIASDGAIMRGISLVNGQTILHTVLPWQITGPVVLARMVEAAEDGAYLVVPTTTGLIGVVHDPASPFGRSPGEILWAMPTQREFTHLISEAGVLYAFGPKGGAALELPRPSRKLVWSDYVSNWIFVGTVVAVMTYFFFSFRQSAKPVAAVSTAGRWMLMIAFGAFFGNTVMTRMSYLLDRLMFLIDDWLKPFLHYLFG